MQENTQEWVIKFSRLSNIALIILKLFVFNIEYIIGFMNKCTFLQEFRKLCVAM